MTQANQTKRTPEEFAANYPVAKSDGIYVATIGNINEHNGKIYVNLCMKTAKSGAKNAVYVRPVPGTPGKFGPWGALPYYIQKGARVNVEVTDGYPNKLSAIIAKPLTTAVAQSAQDDLAGQEVVKTATEIIAQAKEQAEEMAPEKAEELELAEANTDEKPF